MSSLADPSGDHGNGKSEEYEAFKRDVFVIIVALPVGC